jgi:hypothetical protein
MKKKSQLESRVPVCCSALLSHCEGHNLIPCLKSDTIFFEPNKKKKTWLKGKSHEISADTIYHNTEYSASVKS